MIAVGETQAYAAEVPFYLPSANPLVGVTGHVWHDAGGGVTDELQVMVPGGSFINATIAKIVEKGFGRYALQLSSGQCTTSGVVYVRTTSVYLANAPSQAQPAFETEVIGATGGELGVALQGIFPFYLPNATDPIFGTPVIGHSFSAGEVLISLPNSTYADANLANVVAIGNGAYALVLSPTDTATRGKAYLYVNVSGAQRFEDFITILGVGYAPSPTPPAPTPIPIPPTTAPQFFADHASLAISRLCQQFKFVIGDAP